MTKPKRHWPVLGSKSASGARAFLERRANEMTIALAGPSAPGSVAAAMLWLTAFARERRRLPQRDTLGLELANSLREAGLHSEADRIAVADDEIDDVADVSTDAAVLAARAAVEMLINETTVGSWEIVEGLRQRTDRLGVGVAHCLGRAFDEHAAFRERFLQLADSSVREVVAQQEAAEFAEERKEIPSLLDVWFGLREGYEPVHRLVAHDLLGAIASFDPTRFMSGVASFARPHDVQASLDETSAYVDFETWAALVEAAPPAFAADGAWNNSVVLPLLLLVASAAIERTALLGNRDVAPDEIASADTACIAAAAMVAQVVFTRADGAPAAWRWSAWLARSMMAGASRGRSVPTDSRDPGYMAWQLASALAERAKEDRSWTALKLDVVPDEEAWFAIMAKVMAAPLHASGAEDQRTNLTDILRFWPHEDRPEAWSGLQGQKLREASSVVRTFARRPTTLGVRLLAMPMTMASNPTVRWRDLWRRCLVLREAVAFDNMQSAPRDDRDPQAASELLQLVVDIGLCVVDQLLDERIEAPVVNRKAALGALATHLWGATNEMLVLDQFGIDAWEALRRHLIVRLATFGDRFVDPAMGSTALDVPTLIASLAAADRSFFSLLTTLLSAQVTAEDLAILLKSAGIDLNALLDDAERLNAVDERRPIVSVEDLRRLRAIGELLAMPKALSAAAPSI